MSFVSIDLSGTTATNVWSTILTGLTTALVAGIVLFLLNWLREYLTARWKRHSEAEVLAFSLATQLDRLISDCTDVVDDPLTSDPETGYAEATVRSPSLVFAETLPWAVFDKRLQYRIRSLPNKIDAAIRSCSNIGEYGDGPPDYDDYFEERQLRFCWIGLEACLLTEELAAKFGVEILDRGEWEPEENFKSTISKIDERRKVRKAAWQPPDFMRDRLTLEDLEKRRTTLAQELEAAIAKHQSAH